MLLRIRRDKTETLKCRLLGLSLALHRDTQRMNWNSAKYFCLELVTMWVYEVISANTETGQESDIQIGRQVDR